MRAWLVITALVALLLVVCVATAETPLPEELARAVFEAWKVQHGKWYASEEEHEQRFSVFRANLDGIRAHNARSDQTFTLRMNQFGDLTVAEFAAQYLHRPLPMHAGYGADLPRSPHTRVGEPPAARDWRKSGAVTPVKNQGQCGSSWAYPVTGALEGAMVLQAKSKLVALSEQELVDCSSSEGNYGCNGGEMDYAFQYVIKNGLASESAYRYKAEQDTCRDPLPARTIAVGEVKSYTDVTPNSDADMLDAVGNVGPVAVGLNASSMAFQFYSHGVFSDSSCPTTNDHGALVIGYDTYQGQAYWVVKNSWGSGWGNEGYIWMARGPSTNMCGILATPSYPVLDSE